MLLPRNFYTMQPEHIRVCVNTEISAVMWDNLLDEPNQAKARCQQCMRHIFIRRISKHLLKKCTYSQTLKKSFL